MSRVKQQNLDTAGFVLGENIVYGSDHAKAAVLAMAIDDGVPSRGHRNNMFAHNFQQVGVCNGKHKMLKHMAVLMYRGIVEL